VRLLRLDPYGSGDPASTWNLVRVDTDQGVWGLGEAYWGTGLRPVFDDLLAPQLVGENPLDIALVTLLTTRWGGTHTPTGLVMAAISGLEIALWDLAGKLTGLPAYRLLGGTFRDRVRLYRTLISVEPALAQWVVRLPVCSLLHWHPPTA
jgi:L-alanine-DL-glutamate epimerase-like enolase superfamily enzyme